MLAMVCALALPMALARPAVAAFREPNADADVSGDVGRSRDGESSINTRGMQLTAGALQSDSLTIQLYWQSPGSRSAAATADATCSGTRIRHGVPTNAVRGGLGHEPRPRSSTTRTGIVVANSGATASTTFFVTPRPDPDADANRRHRHRRRGRPRHPRPANADTVPNRDHRRRIPHRAADAHSDATAHADTVRYRWRWRRIRRWHAAGWG